MQQLSSVHAEFAERCRNDFLSIRVGRFIPLHHPGQHNAGCIPVWHAGCAVKNMADGMARPVGHPALRADHGEPHAHLTIMARVEV